MSSGHRMSGELYINCAEGCQERFHVFIERDYENDVNAWQVVVGPHDTLYESIIHPSEVYFDMVDNDSTFFLQPITIGTIDDLAGELVKEIAEAEEQEREVRNDGDHFVRPDEEKNMRYENLGPVSNPDGTPTELTKAMLADTGRDPVAFAQAAKKPTDGTEDDHLEAAYEDGQSADGEG